MHVHIPTPCIRMLAVSNVCAVLHVYRYPWNVLFTGLRILFEAGDVYDGGYFAEDENGQYTGYQ